MFVSWLISRGPLGRRSTYRLWRDFDATGQSRDDHRDLSAVLGVLGMNGHQVALFKLNCDQNVGCRHRCEQQVGKRHNWRTPKDEQPAHIERMAHDAVQKRRAKL